MIDLEKGLSEFKNELLDLEELVAGKQVALGTETKSVRAEVDQDIKWKVIGKVPDPAKLERIKQKALGKFKAEITKSGDTSKAWDVTIDFSTNGVTVRDDNGQVLWNGKIS